MRQTSHYFFSVLGFLISATAVADTTCKWLDPLPEIRFEANEIVACPSETEEHMYWFTNGTRRKTRTSAQSGPPIWKANKNAHATIDPCASSFVHHSDGERTDGIPKDVKSRWHEPNQNIQEFNDFLLNAGTAQCEKSHPIYGYWCHLLAEAEPITKPLEEENLSCLDAKVSDIGECYPARQSLGITDSSLMERKDKLSLLEWALINRTRIDPSRQFIIMVPEIVANKKEPQIIARYRICTKD